MCNLNYDNINCKTARDSIETILIRRIYVILKDTLLSLILVHYAAVRIN